MAGVNDDEAASGMQEGEEISSIERKRRNLININRRLRKGILAFRERQDQLLEFIEVEHGVEEVPRYEKNKQGMSYVLGITGQDNVNGKRSQKYVQMLHLIRLGNNYWKRMRSQIHRPSNTDARLRFENNVPEELAALRLHVNFDTGLIKRKPIKRCHKCYDDSHEMKFCPYKLAESRTPEVMAMIQARLDKIKEEEGSDPMISQKYKKKHFKIDEKRDKRRMQQEQRKEAKRRKKMDRDGQF